MSRKTSLGRWMLAISSVAASMLMLRCSGSAATVVAGAGDASVDASMDGSARDAMPESGAAEAGADAGPMRQSGALFGAHIKPYPAGYPGYVAGQSADDATKAMEARIGRTFAVDRLYLGFGDDIQASTAADRAAGRISLVSWDQTGPWADLASGAQDAAIAKAIEQVKAIASSSPNHNRLLLCFDHEADLSVGPTATTGKKGSAADFVAAWKYIWSKFHDAGVTNVSWVWIMTHENFAKEDALYPGDAFVDYPAWDGYDPYPCKDFGPQTSFETIFAPERAFAIAHNKQWMIPEFGVQEDAPAGWSSAEGKSSATCADAVDAGVISCDSTCDSVVNGPADPNAKASWIAAALATIKTWPELAAVLYFHSDSAYQWWVDTPSYTDTSPSFIAFKAMAHDSYLSRTTLP